MSFQHGLSGLSAAARNLDVIGNNVANANTVGAKASRAEFSDMYANSLTGVAMPTAGIGVAVTSVAQQFTQGDIVATQNPLDMAINGRGFFRVSQNGTALYSRNGQFRMDKDGYITTGQGARLTGYPVDGNGRISNGTPTELRISTADIAPKQTEQARAQFNLDAREPVKNQPGRRFDSADPSTYSGGMSMSVYDTLGRDHQMTMYFVKVSSNQWEIHGAADGQDLVPKPATDVPRTPLATLTFDTGGKVQSVSANGVTSTPADVFDVTIPVAAGGAVDPLSFKLDLRDVTQFGASFSTNELSQDGFGSGRLSGFSADENGVIVGRYSNGQTRPQGQIVLASFVNPQGLVPIGNNMWAESSAAGQPTLGAPGTGILGALEGGAIENSNVDLTSELVSMITAQRAYQANAQTIKTHDQMLQTIVNLR